MCERCDHYEAVCRAEFAEIKHKLDQLDEALRGNGRPGVNTRLQLLEADAARRARWGWLLAAGVVGLALNAVWERVFGG